MSSLGEPYTYDDVRGVWYYGEPDAGKSRAAREKYPDAFIKPQNKWWDGYQGQEAVILDDLDHKGACLDHYLKIWADRYSCSGEVKGYKVELRHKVFVVTSNYTPEELWQDAAVVAAIRRRFKFTHFKKGF